MGSLRVPAAGVLSLFLLAAFLFIVSSEYTSAQDLELTMGLNSIGISEEMANRQLGSLLAACDINFALVYDAKGIVPAQAEDCRQGNWVTIESKAGSSLEHCKTAVTENMVGMGLFVLTTKPSCKVPIKKFPDSFGHSAELEAGINLISIPNNMRGSSFNDLANNCKFISILDYNPAYCASGDAAKEECVGAYYKLPQAFKIDQSSLGKAMFVTVESDCTLKEATTAAQAAPPACNEAECAAKTGCYGTELQTYGCKDNKCEVITKVTCKGVDLVPRVDVKMPGQGQSAGQGDTIQFDIYVKNNGDTSTYQQAAKESVYTLTFSLENTETGAKVKQEYKTVNSVDADKNVPAGGETKLATYTWSATEGKYKVRVKVDSNNEITEAQGGEANNEIVAGRDGKAYEAGKNELAIGSMSTNLPDLIVVKPTVSISPKLLCRPSIVKTMSAKVKNIGAAPAVPQGNFLEVKTSIREVLQDGTVKVTCSNDNSNDIWRSMATIEAGKEETVSGLGLKTAGGGECELLPGKDYYAVVEADTLAIGANPVGVVQESDEQNNAIILLIADETACSKIGERIGNCYCSIDKKPLTQVVPYQSCTHNFECKYEFCVKGKCVTEPQKNQILSVMP